MEWLMSLDGDILLWIQENIRKEFLSPAVERITHLGDAGWFWIALLAFMLFFSKCRKTAVTGLLAVLIGFLITNLWLKNMVARVRPYEIVEGLQLIGNRAVDFSFPSGHSTCSVAASTVLFIPKMDWRAGPCPCPVDLFFPALYWNSLSDRCDGGDSDRNGVGFSCDANHAKLGRQGSGRFKIKRRGV